MTWAIGAGAVLATLALAGFAWTLWSRSGGRIATPEEAADAIEAALPGFATVGAVVGADGAAALAVGRDGRVAVCRRRGGRLVAREVGWAAVRATPAGVLVDSGARGFGAVTIAGVDALDVRRLSP